MLTQAPDKLVQVISRFLEIDPQLLSESTSLFHEHGVAGDDGVELLELIEAEFKIDMSGVDSSKYFGTEAALLNPFYFLYCLLWGRKLDHGIVRLEISDIRRSVETGVWQEPEKAKA